MRLIPLVFIFIFILIFVFPPNTSFATENNVPMISDDGKYYLQIVMYQWQFDIYNLQENGTIEDAIKDSKPIASSGPDATIGPFLINTGIVFEVYSKDVQHGFAINDLGIALATVRPSPGETLGEKTSAATILPSEPTTLQSNCYIFCGLGHPDEKMSFEVVANLNDNSSKQSENLTIPVPILPLLFALSVIGYFAKIKRMTN